MKSFKFFWNAHKWTGIVLSVILACTAVTGLLLIVKKRFDWIQPPTLAGAPGGVGEFISLAAALDVARSTGQPAFATGADIDRIDVRPNKRVYKIQSRHDYLEIQVCAVTGAVLSVATRRSDFIENLHDGSLIAGWFHDWIMPVASVGLAFLVGSGLWLWVEPALRRRRRRRRGRITTPPA